MLRTIPEVQQLIATGTSLFLAGSADALSQLPAGNWIGGSIPYFMGAQGGVHSESSIFVTEVPGNAAPVTIREYSCELLPELYRDAPANGFTFLLIPNGAPFLQTFARDASECDGFLLKPMIGWVTGMQLSDIDTHQAVVVDGRSLKSSSQSALAMHVPLPATQFAEVEIVNIFKPGSGDVITFPRSGFEVRDCFVNGKPANFAEYLRDAVIDTQLPLTADYCGSILNVSIQSVQPEAGAVHLYAPIFHGIQYRFAEPIGDYVQAFAAAIPKGHEALFSCNCILNYVYGKLAGQRTGEVTGPITFGEIAHQLLNQTMVQLSIREAA
jgi:hypothetical protein